MPLSCRRSGRGPRLVLLHGFTQTGESLAALAALLERHHEVLLPDLPGHGASPPASGGLEGAARAVAATCGRASYLGYSLGGRVALRLALDRPDLVERLVLVSTTAGIEDAGERAARRAADEELARRLEAEGLEGFLEDWLARPLFATLPPDRRGLEARLGNDPRRLARALRELGTGAQEPLWDRLDTLVEANVPVLVVAGAADAKFVALGRRLAASLGPVARLEVVPECGHALPLEAPEDLARLVEAFLGSPPPEPVARRG